MPPTTRTTTTVERVMKASGNAKDGDHTLKECLREGHIMENGKRIRVAVAVWENSLIKLHDSVYDKEMPYDLTKEDLSLTRAWKAVKNPREYTCRFCNRGFYDRSNGIRHETKTCSEEGAPNHICNKHCSKNVVGPYRTNNHQMAG
uniref:Uncharacterized protein n=1 Tax=Tetranychus urticae TaxID=32264 RepID=T1KID7_TETUR